MKQTIHYKVINKETREEICSPRINLIMGGFHSPELEKWIANQRKNKNTVLIEVLEKEYE